MTFEHRLPEGMPLLAAIASDTKAELPSDPGRRFALFEGVLHAS